MVYQDKALSARRMSSPHVPPLLPAPSTSTPCSRLGENESLHSIVSMSSNSVLSDSPPPTPAADHQGTHSIRPTPKLKSLSSSRLHSEVTTMTTSPPVISPSHSHYSSFNFEGELDKDISSAYSNMSLDTPLQGEYIDEPVQMSPETERKLLLAHSAPLVPDIIKKSVDYLQSKGKLL